VAVGKEEREMKFHDWLAEKVGTRRWVVTNRLGSKMAEKHDLAISRKRFLAYQYEYVQSTDFPSHDRPEVLSSPS
jgi:hypothetical protein